MRHETGLRTPIGNKQKRPMNAFQAFASVNATRLSIGQSIDTVAPEAPVKPVALPPVLLTAAADTGAADDAPTFTLTLTLPAYADTFHVYAAPPLLVGQYPTGKNSVIIGTYTNAGPGTLDLAGAFADKFGPIYAGQQVNITLVPVSAQGFKGTPLSLVSSVIPGSAARKTHGKDTRALKAA